MMQTEGGDLLFQWRPAEMGESRVPTVFPAEPVETIPEGISK